MPVLCFLVLSAAASGAVHSFARPDTPVVQWVNAPDKKVESDAGVRSLERSIADPGFSRAVETSGPARIRLQANGRHFVEVLLLSREERDTFSLVADGKVVDARFARTPRAFRLRPRSGTRRLFLLGWITGPAQLTVETEAGRWSLAGLRYTPEREMNSDLVPRWRERTRRLTREPAFDGMDGGPEARARHLVELGERLRLADDRGIRAEGLLALTRGYYWLAAENHEPGDLDRTGELLAECHKAMPAESTVRQMISAACAAQTTSREAMVSGELCRTVKAVPWEIPALRQVPNAPAWATAQLRLARRMEALTRWWVEERQRPDGQLGGGWGDDVEIIRHWAPQALGLGSPLAARGIAKIADGVWTSGTLEHGYDRRVSDVEHSSEPTTDTQPLLAALRPDDPAVQARLAETAACSGYWIQRQPDGFWRFRSSWFNCREADTAPNRALDVHLNVRAMGPALWHAAISRDPELIARLIRWGESWLHAMRAREGGKPAGLIPSALRSTDGSYLIGSTQWDKPNAEWDYFQWSGSSQEALTSFFLGLHDLTGDRRWLDAAGESFSILNNCLGSEKYCQAIRQRPEAYDEWQRRTGQAAAEAPDAILTRMAGEARDMERRLAVNFDMYTREVLYTDRVYYPLTPWYRQHLFGGEMPRGERPPLFAVTWEPTEEEYARAVLHADAGRIEMRVFNFETREITARFRVWRLAPGRYLLNGAPVEITRPAQQLEIRIPPGRETAVVVNRP